MSDWRIDEQQLSELNAVLQRADDVLVHNCVTRTAQESKLFPILPYLMNVMIETYYRYPDLLREASQHVTPEEVGHRSREVERRYLPADRLGDAELLPQRPRAADPARHHPPRGQPRGPLDVHGRLVAPRMPARYHRIDGHVNALDAGDINAVHDERDAAGLRGRRLRVRRRAAPRAREVHGGGDAVQRSSSTARAASASQSSGPYRLGGGRLMHTRDFLNLAECELSWLDGVAAGVTYNNLTVVVITDGVRVEITDWGTAYTTPEQTTRTRSSASASTRPTS